MRKLAFRCLPAYWRLHALKNKTAFLFAVLPNSLRSQNRLMQTKAARHPAASHLSLA